MPHKQAIMDLVDDPGDIRGTIGAMNTVVRQPDGALIGTSTDAAGFYSPLDEADLEGEPVAVFGAAGAASAVLFALARGSGRAPGRGQECHYEELSTAAVPFKKK